MTQTYIVMVIFWVIFNFEALLVFMDANPEF